MRRPLFYGWVIVLAAAIISAMGYGVLYSFGVFLKPLSSDFGWSRTATSGAYAASMAARVPFTILLGTLTDKYGPRLVSAIGAILMGLGMLLAAGMDSLWQLYLIYTLLIGGGISAVWIPLSVTVARWFQSRRGLALGLLGAGSGIGIMVMSPVAGTLVHFWGISTGYIVVGSVGLALSLGSALLLKKSPEDMGLSPYGASVVLEASKPRTPESPVHGAVASFTFRESIRTRHFWVLALVNLGFMFCLHTIMTTLVAHATDLGISSLTAPTLLSIIGGLNTAGVLILGPVGDRIGLMRLYGACLAVAALTVLWMATVSSFALFCVFAVIFGFCYGGNVVLLPGAAARYFGSRSLGAIFGCIGSVSMLGGVVGPVLGNFIYEATTPHSYTLAYWVVGGTALASSSLFLLLASKPAPQTT